MKNLDDSKVAGALFIVATPIGNLADISSRATEILQTVDIILAEDTRHSLKLIKALGIKKPLEALHNFNEKQKCDLIISKLQAGLNFALISDSGTPIIADPGFLLVNKARQANIKVIPIPGACALITALSVAGIACENFLFLNFLPAKKLHRAEILKKIFLGTYTTIVYESPHRILDCAEEIVCLTSDDYRYGLAKELTKIHETIMNDTAKNIFAWLKSNKENTKGEFVLILPPIPQVKSKDHLDEMIENLLIKYSPKETINIITLVTKINKNKIYQRVLEFKKK